MLLPRLGPLLLRLPIGPGTGAPSTSACVLSFQASALRGSRPYPPLSRTGAFSPPGMGRRVSLTPLSNVHSLLPCARPSWVPPRLPAPLCRALQTSLRRRHRPAISLGPLLLVRLVLHSARLGPLSCPSHLSLLTGTSLTPLALLRPLVPFLHRLCHPLGCSPPLRPSLAVGASALASALLPKRAPVHSGFARPHLSPSRPGLPPWTWTCPSSSLLWPRFSPQSCLAPSRSTAGHGPCYNKPTLTASLPLFPALRPVLGFPRRPRPAPPASPPGRRRLPRRAHRARAALRSHPSLLPSPAAPRTSSMAPSPRWRRLL